MKKKQHSVLQLLLQPRTRQNGPMSMESEMNSWWQFMLKRQHSRQSKATNVVLLCGGLLTNWTNVTGDTCKTEAERDAL